MHRAPCEAATREEAEGRAARVSTVCLVPTQTMNLGILSKYNRILRTSTGLSARINVTRGTAAQWCSRRRLISAGIGGSRALGVSSRAVSRPFARPTCASQARGARPGRPIHHGRHEMGVGWSARMQARGRHGARRFGGTAQQPRISPLGAVSPLGARPGRPQEGFPSTLMGCFPAQGSHAGGECSCTPCRRCSRSSRRCEIAFWFSIWYLLVVMRRAPLPTLLGLFVHDDP